MNPAAIAAYLLIGAVCGACLLAIIAAIATDRSSR